MRQAGYAICPSVSMAMLSTRVHSEMPLPYAMAGHPLAFHQNVYVVKISQLNMLSHVPEGISSLCVIITLETSQFHYYLKSA